MNSDCVMTVIPGWLVLHPGVGDAALRLFALLSLRLTVHSTENPSRNTLAKGLHVSLDSIDRGMRALADAGAIKVTKDGRRNLYTLCYTSPREYADLRLQHESAPPRDWENVQLTTRTVAAIEEYVSKDYTHSSNYSTVQGTVPPDFASGPGPLSIPRFVSIWNRYPHRQYRDRATQRWLKLGVEENPTLFAEIEQGLTRWLAYWDAELTPRRYIPYLHNWLANQRWRDRPVIEPRLSEQSRSLVIAAKDLLKEEA